MIAATTRTERTSELAASGPVRPASRRAAIAALLALLALTTLVRLPGIARPLVGSFATKNAVYGTIARNCAEGRSSVWRPTLDVVAGGERAWHLVEFPVSAYVSGGLWKLCGGSLDVWGRLTSVGFSVASVGLLFASVRRWHGAAAAWGAATALALAPVSVIYGQSFMLEASVVCFTLATFSAFENWLSRGRTLWLVLAAVCLALLLLTKIYMLVVFLPLGWMAVRAVVSRNERKNQPEAQARDGDRLALASASGWCGWRASERNVTQGVPYRRIVGTLAAGALAVLPAVAWYADAYRTAAPDNPLAERVFYSVRQSGEAHGWPHPLLRSAEFYRQALDDLAGVALTPIGLGLALLGLLHREWRRHAAWLAAMALLGLALPRKFHEMNYYYLVVLPPLCVLVGLGWQALYDRLRPRPLAIAGLLAVSLVFSLRYAARPAFATPDEDRGVVAAAAVVREWTPFGERVVTMHGSTIDLLYYCDRPGWALSPEDPLLAEKLASCRREGARLLAVAASLRGDEGVACDRLLAEYELLRAGDGYRVYRLETAVSRAVER